MGQGQWRLLMGHEVSNFLLKRRHFDTRCPDGKSEGWTDKGAN